MEYLVGTAINEITKPTIEELDRITEEGVREFDQLMEEMYREHPEMRPSQADLQAEALRERADQIEQEEFDRLVEKMRLKRIAELRKILQLVKDRAE